MSKAIKWQIPFVSTIDKIRYRIDIYAEGYTGTPIQLTAGPQPFVTEENKSEDFFTPVRTQTGNIQICTALPSGGMLSPDDILPENNISRPVQLWKIGTSSNTIEWQGFLSCEAYSQAYTEIPEIFSFPVLSVLEAMDSVEVSQTRSSGLSDIAGATYNVLNEINIQSGMTMFTYINFSQTSWRIFQKAIDQTLFFKSNEYNNENSTTYIVSGISSLNALRRLCVFMGWIAREQGTELYLEYIGETIGMYRVAFANFVQSVIITPGTMPTKAITTQDIVNCVWRGIGHKRNISQGAKSVEVVAKLEKYEINIGIPECPTGSLSERYGELENSVYLYVLGNSNMNAYSNMSFAYYSAYFGFGFVQVESYSNSTFSVCFGLMAAGTGSSIKYYLNHFSPTMAKVPFSAGSFLAKYCWEDTGTAVAHNTTNALYCVFFPKSLQASWTINPSNFNKANVGAIFSISNVINYRCNNGYLRLFAEADSIFLLPETPALQHFTDFNYEWLVSFELQFGNKWWNGSSWQSSQCTFNASMIKGGFKDNWENTMPIEETSGLLIPITSEMSGIVTFKIWPLASDPNYGNMGTRATLEMIFSSLSVEHILPDNDKLSDRSENHYFRLLGTNFSDEAKVNAEMASYLNNQPSPSLIMTDATTPANTIDYTVSGGGTESRRPEVDLLNRLATYYGAVRQRLELIVAHPTAAPLPLLKLNGINDGNVYLPLAESRDWINDTSTLTCFETPN